VTTTESPVRNGVDTATLFATLDAVKGTPEIAKFQFRATNKWVRGTHNRSTIDGFYGAMQEMTHQQPWTFDADHPAVLVGTDNGPTPVEFVLHALAACLTAGLANISRTRCATGSRPSASASRCAATTQRSCARSSTSRASAPPFSTSSPTRCR